jgi:glucose-1-phosphate cytidylyltransferase
MKVVLFCGGMGMRLYPSTENIPKPMVLVGEKPMLWHLMKYYSHFGHKDFILCLGYKGEEIKKFFLNYDECLSNDFTLFNGGKKRKLLKSDLEDWKITFADTGLHANIGQRLKAVEHYLEEEDVFLANYSDAVTDMPLPKMVDFFTKKGKIACFMAVKPFNTFHIISSDSDGLVIDMKSIDRAEIRINGGFFVFRKEIFSYIKEGEELVNEPFHRLIREKELGAYKYDGFWGNMDTYKDKQKLDELVLNDKAPWEIWKPHKK